MTIKFVFTISHTGSNEIPNRKQLDTFAATNINIVNSLSIPTYAMYFDPNQWTEIVIRDSLIKRSSSSCVYFYRQFARLLLYKVHCSDTYDGLRFRGIPLMFMISKSSFRDISRFGLYLYSSYYEYLTNNKTMTVEDTYFDSVSSTALYFSDYYGVPSAVFDAHWFIANCTFKNTAYGLQIRSRSSISYNTVVPRFTIKNCKFFETSQTAIYVPSGPLWKIFILESTFLKNHQTIVYILRADEFSSLSVINNTFEANNAQVLKISNELPQCHIKDNAFLNNSASTVVEYFEAVPLSSAMTSEFDYIFSGNYLKGNYPAGTLDYKGLTCTIITRHLIGKFQYNFFGNDGFLYEFCIGTFPFFDVDASLDVTLNNWNTANDSLIDQKIFDINDWNDRPGVTFRPYIIPEDQFQRPTIENDFIIPLFGGKLLKDEVLTASESPYFVRSDITIPDNVTLTIEPGVELLFAPNVGILVTGSLVASGRINDRIVMKTGHLNFTRLSWGAVRLVDGSSPWQGRLEIYLNGEWGTVCRDYWNLNNARVVCRQLGMGSPVSTINYDFTGTPPDPIWLDDVRCSGNEAILSECPSRGIGVHNCGHHEDVGLECEHGLWGGIRIIGTQDKQQPSSILEHVDIFNTGYLHYTPYPALFIRHASPQIHDVNIVNSTSHGILIDTPVTDFKLVNVSVQRTENGVVLLKTGNVMLELDNVTTIDNENAGVVVHEEDSNIAFRFAFFETIPICGPRTEDFIMVEQSADLYIHIPRIQNYRSSRTSYEIRIQSIRNQTIVLQVFMPYYYYSNNYISIYDDETSELLGTTRDYAEHLTVASQSAGRTLRIYTYSDMRYGMEAYIRAITTDEKSK